MSHLVVDWWQQPDQRWVARCHTEPGWRYGPVETDPMLNDPRDGAEKALKAHRTRNVKVEHLYWPHREVAE
jgi:hypothetical protein